MKNFKITAKGTVSHYIKENAIKAKNEVSSAFFLGPGNGADSCFRIADLEISKGLSVSL